MNNLPRAQWSSFSSYVLVTTGAVVGLGNVFLFPFLVAKYGGLFVLFYVLCELLVSIPIMLSEFLLGRRGKQNPVGAISILAMEAGASRHWRWIGWLCFVIVFLTLSYYSVAVAFPLDYFFEAAKSLIGDVPWVHTNLAANIPEFVICFLLFLGVTMIVIARGINRGLEGISRITVPLYIVLLIILFVYACVAGNFSAALHFLVHASPNVTVLQIVFAALTYAFFKLGTGMGTMIVYGSYLPYRVTFGKSTATIIGLDILVSLLSYFTIYAFFLLENHSAVLTQGVYTSVMEVFLATPNGILVATVFFLAAVMAAWTPTIAMAEAACITLIERFNLTRLRAVWIIGVGALILGIFIVLSYNEWSDVLLFNRWTIRQVVQNIAADILTPLSAFLTAIFVGWIVRRRTTSAELGFKPLVYSIWRFLIRFLAPAVILIIGLVMLLAHG